MAGPTQYRPQVVANAEARAKLRFGRRQAELDLSNYQKHEPEYLKADIDMIGLKRQLSLKTQNANREILKKTAPKDIRLNSKLSRLSLRQNDHVNELATKQSLQQFKRYGDDQARVVRSMQEALDPKAFAAREAAGQAAMDDFKLGGALSRQEEEEWNNRIRARQAATGNYMGNASITSEAMTKGQAGFERRQQRLDRLTNFGNTMQQPAQAPTIFHPGNPVAAGGGASAMPQSMIGGGGLLTANTGSRTRPVNLGEAPLPDLAGYAAANTAEAAAQKSKPSPWMGAMSGALSGAAMGAPYAGATYGMSALGGALLGGVMGYAASGGF